jgi:hypothetical protein
MPCKEKRDVTHIDMDPAKAHRPLQRVSQSIPMKKKQKEKKRNILYSVYLPPQSQIRSNTIRWCNLRSAERVLARPPTTVRHTEARAPSTATRCACSRGATTASTCSASIRGWPRIRLARRAGTRSWSSRIVTPATATATPRQQRWRQGKRHSSSARKG